MSVSVDTPLARAARALRDYPIVALLVLLALMILALHLMSPGIINERWIANTVKFIVPLAMLAACQTLTMYTGGIDLSAAAVGTIASFVMATQVPHLGAGPAILIALVPGVLIGLLNGFGVGICRVHPLIMTLGSGLIGTGCLQVYQRYTIASGSQVPPFLEWLGTGVSFGFVPNSLVVFVPFAALILYAQNRTGFGRLLYAVGANERAARLSGLRPWQLYLALYTLSGLIAGMAGLIYVGLIKAPSLSLVDPRLLPSVAAAVIGGTSIFGGRGSYAGTIVGAAIITVLATILNVMGPLTFGFPIPEGVKIIVNGGIILIVTAIYMRLTDNG